MKIQLLSCLLVVLLCVCGMEQDPDLQETPYEKFLRQHVIGEMDAKDCTKVIKKKSIASNGKCKPVNTFIVTSNKLQVDEVCTKGKRFNPNYRQSVNKFNVVTCRKAKDEKLPCAYEGKKQDRYVVLVCEDGLPVHFNKTVKMFNTTTWLGLSKSDS
ncbi:angiogenin-4-like isoform X2 [Alosa sapidissima]|uniref:angiogenin-4-like isoform X2 n=1 Tax=Alosa sapidissima TaxID=34773 RepID=UPI001C0868B3|nr:angiogenin-4-like isoform X2 [Alosa sapidissima]